MGAMNLINAIVKEINKNNMDYAFTGYTSYFYLYDNIYGPLPIFIDIDCDKDRLINILANTDDIHINRNIIRGIVELYITYKGENHIVRIRGNNKHRLSKERVEMKGVSTYKLEDLQRHSLFDFVSARDNIDDAFLILSQLPADNPDDFLLDILMNFNYRLTEAAKKLKFNEDVLSYLSKYEEV